MPKLCVVVLLLLALVEGCGSSGEQTASSPTPTTLTLALKIGSVVAATPSCAATPIERGRATTVVVSDDKGDVLATGRTSAATTAVQTTTAFGDNIFSKGCLFDFQAQVPAVSTYHVKVSGRYAFTVPRAQVEKPDLRLFIEYRCCPGLTSSGKGILVALPPVNGLLPPG